MTGNAHNLSSKAGRALGIFVLVAMLLLAIGSPQAVAADPGKGDPQPAANEPDAVPGELIVGFKPDADEATRQRAVAVQGGQTKQEIADLDLKVITVPADQTKAVQGKLLADPAVRYAVPNYIRSLHVAPNDPRYPEDYGLNNTGQTIDGQSGTPDADIDAPEAWDITTGSSSIVVGTIDTGIDYNHPDLAANVWTAPSGWSLRGCTQGSHGFRTVSGPVTCDPMDDHDHGTHVAGTIGAVGDNGVGVAGVNWHVQVLAIKAFNSGGTATDAALITAIQIAVEVKRAGVNLKVLNNSWGGGFMQAFEDALREANDEGILIVASAGNSNSNNDTSPQYPSNYALPNVIAVAATDNRDQRASFSNYGVQTVHIAAPGVDVLSTTRNNTYNFFSGTSMAAPHVSGAAALVLSAPGLGGLTVTQLKQRLLYCADTVPGLATVVATSNRLNVKKAIDGCTLPQVTLTTTTSPPGAGSVAVSPNQATYAAGSTVTLTATPASTYVFAGWTVNGTAQGATNPLTTTLYKNTTVTATFGQPPPNDTFPGFTVAGLPYRDTELTTYATSQPGEPNPTCSAFGESSPFAVWYSFTSPVTRTVTVQTRVPGGPDSAMDTLLAVYTGGAVNQLTEVTCNDDFSGYGLRSRLSFTATAGTTYRIRAGGWSSRTGTLVVDITSSTYLLGLTTTGAGTATPSQPGPGYPAGTPITINAAPIGSHILVGWTVDGTASGTTNPLPLTMDRDHTVVAAFTGPPVVTVPTATATYGDASVTLTATLATLYGEPFTGGTVTFVVRQGATVRATLTNVPVVGASPVTVSVTLPLDATWGARSYAVQANYSGGRVG
ncbi:MAG: S8 family serine peptidase [Thermomicrobiales bacterium]